MNTNDDVATEETLDVRFVCSVFALTGHAGYFAPGFNIRYDEKDIGNTTFITGGGTRLYLSRVGDNLDQSGDAQAADSHFMADRVVAGLLISGAGLFRAFPMGRIFVDTPVEKLRWHSQIDLQPFYSERVRAVYDAFDENEFASWFQFICENIPVRRALHDAVQAINNPVEAFVYIYRGFEWLKKGLNLSWDEIAGDIGVTTKQIKAVGQIANDESGVRHASRSGEKQRASLETYSTWIAGLIDAIESARARVDKSYTASDSKQIAEKLKVAIQYDPYP
ncbi:hypothetical protein [Hoeflea poritis]|uniref:Uncharacterized protein n=1 Tax=Hoeflea poritis TaxID=2993659 RepID=A0ABT4VV85_9HYPH|nr:hypothetical protein [Hoeflea poritis]MDA4848615.1 hypothetical protein [Hoeflea poritis]